MTTSLNEILEVTFETIGSCILIPLHKVPEEFSSYHTTLTTAENLSVKELPPLTHQDVQEIFLGLSRVFLEHDIPIHVAVSVYLSGVHDSYIEVQKDTVAQKYPCITCMDLFFFQDGTLSEMTLHEILITEKQEINGDDLLYVLFLES